MESRFAASLNGLLQQNLPQPDRVPGHYVWRHSRSACRHCD